VGILYCSAAQLALIVIGKSMARTAIHKRVEVKPELRGIERVAWIKED
jgi:hypothetical protein